MHNENRGVHGFEQGASTLLFVGAMEALAEKRKAEMHTRTQQDPQQDETQEILTGKTSTFAREIG